MSFLRIRPERDFDENGVDRNQRRIVLIGKTGVGKSSTGNTILGGKYFKSKLSGESITSECGKKEVSRFDKSVLVVDTPGIFDTKMKNEDVMKEVVKCVSISVPGPHVFLIVISVARFTEEDENTIKEFLKCFSEDALDFSIVVFTGKDRLEEEGQDITEFLETVPHSLTTILEKCGNRYIAFNNNANKDTKKDYVERLLGMVEQMVEENGGSCYTSDIYRTMQRQLQENMEKRKEQETQKRDEKVKALKLQIKNQDEFEKQIRRLDEQFEKNIEIWKLREEEMKMNEEKGFFGHLGHGFFSLGEVLATPFKMTSALFYKLDRIKVVNPNEPKSDFNHTWQEVSSVKKNSS